MNIKLNINKFKKRYAKIAKSKQFLDAYLNKSIGEQIIINDYEKSKIGKK